MPRRTLRRGRLPWVVGALGAVAAVEAVRDVRRARDPLNGPALPLALGAGWALFQHSMLPRPLLTYSRGLAATSSAAVQVPEGGLWEVSVENRGGGGGRLLAIRYFAERDDGSKVNTAEALDLCRLFTDCGYRDDREFHLLRLTGGAFDPGRRVVMFELPLALARRFRRLGVVITYAGPFGEHTALTVDAIRNFGLPDDPAAIPADSAGTSSPSL